MAGIVEFPTVVQEALQEFADLLPNEPQRRHFAEYLTGLYVAARKNVSAINREFAAAGDQSCLNRFLTEATWDVINQRRLALLQDDPSTRYAQQGVIPIDNTLLDHHGELIEDVGWFWDHAEERYKIGNRSRWEMPLWCRSATTYAWLQLRATLSGRALNSAISCKPKQTPARGPDARPQKAGKSLHACWSQNFCLRSWSALLRKTLGGVDSANPPKQRPSLRLGVGARFAPSLHGRAPTMWIPTPSPDAPMIPGLFAKSVTTTVNGYFQRSASSACGPSTGSPANWR
jgi:DDE superfamily endonuclease